MFGWGMDHGMEPCQQPYHIYGHTGRDSFAFLPLRGTGKNYGSNQFLNWLQQYATGILRLNLSSPYSNV